MNIEPGSSQPCACARLSQKPIKSFVLRLLARTIQAGRMARVPKNSTIWVHGKPQQSSSIKALDHANPRWNEAGSTYI